MCWIICWNIRSVSMQRRLGCPMAHRVFVDGLSVGPATGRGNNVIDVSIDVSVFFERARTAYNFSTLFFVGFVDSGYGYGSLIELTEVPGTGIEVLQN